MYSFIANNIKVMAIMILIIKLNNIFFLLDKQTTNKKLHLIPCVLPPLEKIIKIITQCILMVDKPGPGVLDMKMIAIGAHPFGV